MSFAAKHLAKKRQIKKRPTIGVRQQWFVGGRCILSAQTTLIYSQTCSIRPLKGMSQSGLTGQVV